MLATWGYKNVIFVRRVHIYEEVCAYNLVLQKIINLGIAPAGTPRNLVPLIVKGAFHERVL